MSEQELQAWLAKHRGLDVETKSQVGQRIVIAKDGSRVVLTQLTPGVYRMDDLTEKDDAGNVTTTAPPAQSGAPAVAETPATAAPTAAPSASTGNTISQADLDRIVQQQAPGGNVSGWSFSRGTRTKTIQKYGQSETVQVPYVQWIDPKTGRTLEYEVQPGGGSYVEVFNGIKDENKQEPKPSERPQYITAQDGTVYEVTPGQPPKAIIQGAKPGQIVNVGNGRLIRVDQAGTATVIYDDPTGEVKQDKDGNWVRIVGGNVTPIDVAKPVDPAGAGPSIPQIVLGHSEQALRQYKAQLQAEVAAGRKSQAWANERWAEAHQVAQLTMQEATILQRERESNLNASVNLATTKLNSGQSAIQTAMTLVNSINDKLPVGSDLGGKAFVAMVGLQMLNEQRSGINDIKPPADQADRRAADAAAGAARTGSEMLGDKAKPPAAPAATPAPAAATTQPAGQASTPPAAPAAARPATAAPTSTPNYRPEATTDPATTPFAPASMPSAPAADGNERPDDILTVAELTPDGKRTGRTRQMTRAEYDDSLANYPEQARTTVVDNAVPNPARTATPTAPNPPMPEDNDSSRIPGPSESQPLRPWNGLPQPADSVPTATPVVDPVQAPDPWGVPDPYASPTSMAPANDWAALQAYQPMAAPAAPPMEQPAAVLHAQAASTPPWRMTPEQYAQYRAAGIPDEVIRSVPGGVAA